MVIKKKIDPVKEENYEKIREDVISKGASVLADKEDTKNKEFVNFTLRIRVKMLDSIRKDLEERPGTPTSWILDAIYEKLKKED